MILNESISSSDKKLDVITDEQFQSMEKFQFGNVFYAKGQLLGKGSASSAVYDVQTFYTKNATGNYIAHPTNDVIKSTPLGNEQKSIIMQAHPTIAWRKLDPDEKSKLLKQKFQEKLQHECNMLQASGDKNASLSISGGTILLKMSKAEGIPLNNYLAKNKDLTFEERVVLAKQVADAVQELHAKGICHLDLKPENIIYDEKKKKITFIDFGSAQSITANLETASFHTTTPQFDPPDHNKNTPAQIDNYSLAGIVNEVMGGSGYDFKKLREIDYPGGLTSTQIKERESIIKTLEKLGDKDYKQRGENYSALLENEKMQTWFNENKKILQSSNKPEVKQLCAIMASPTTLKEIDTTSLLNKILEEAITKQQKPKISLGFITVNKLGGSDVLKAILKLPDEIKNKLDQDLLKTAEKYSVNILKRKEEIVELTSLKSKNN